MEENPQDLQDRLSDLPFDQLQQLKNRLGAKIYNSTVYGTASRETFKVQKHVRKGPTKDDAPIECSSKKPPGKWRHPHALNSITSAPRDPRFDPLCGTFDRHHFRRNYHFVDDIRQRDVDTLKRQLDSCPTSTQDQTAIKFAVQRLQNQLRESKRLDGHDKVRQDRRRAVTNRLKAGETVKYKKKSVEKLEDLIDKYEQLKGTNRLRKHIEQKTRKKRHLK